MGRLMRWLGTLSGIQDGVTVVRKHARISGEVAGSIKAAARGPAESNLPEHEETFAQAVTRLGLSEAQLQQRYRQFAWRARFFSVLSAVACLLMIHFLADSALANALTCVGLASAFAALAFRAGFYAWQIRQRRLGGLGQYLRHPKAWWP